jgi:hypothetical protein
MNNIGLGICLVGDFGRDQPTRAQLEAMRADQYLREHCPGKARTIMVRPHREINRHALATDCQATRFLPA